MDNQLIPTGNNQGISTNNQNNLPQIWMQHSPCLGSLLASDINKPGNELAQQTFIMSQMEVTPDSAIVSPQLSKLKKESHEFLAAALIRLIFFVNSQFNVANSKKLNTPQIALLAHELIKKYWYMKFDELVYVLREGVDGRWGKTFHKIDKETINGWFMEYEKTERKELIEEKPFSEHNQFKTSVAPPELPEGMYENILSQIVGRLEKEDKERKAREREFERENHEKLRQIMAEPLPQIAAFKVQCYLMTIDELKRLRKGSTPHANVLEIIDTVLKERLDIEKAGTNPTENAA